MRGILGRGRADPRLRIGYIQGLSCHVPIVRQFPKVLREFASRQAPPGPRPKNRPQHTAFATLVHRRNGSVRRPGATRATSHFGSSGHVRLRGVAGFCGRSLKARQEALRHNNYGALVSRVREPQRHIGAHGRGVTNLAPSLEENRKFANGGLSRRRRGAPHGRQVVGRRATCLGPDQSPIVPRPASSCTLKLRVSHRAFRPPMLIKHSKFILGNDRGGRRFRGHRQEAGAPLAVKQMLCLRILTVRRMKNPGLNRSSRAIRSEKAIIRRPTQNWKARGAVKIFLGDCEGLNGAREIHRYAPP